MTLTKEQIEAIKDFNRDFNLEGAAWLKDQNIREFIWDAHDDNSGKINPDIMVVLCDLALAGLSVQPRPIEEAPEVTDND